MIAKQIFKVVFAIYFLVTLVVTTIHMLTEYRTNKNYVHDDLKLMYQTSESGLAAVLWEQDPQQIQFILAEMRQHPSLLGIKIVAPNGQLLGGSGTVVNDKGQSVSIRDNNREVFERRVMGMFAQEHLIAYQKTDGQSVDLGTVILYSNSKIVFLRVRFGFLMILVNAVIKTVALWLIFLAISRFWLSRPLAQLIQATEALDLENPQKVEIEMPTRERNEINILAEAFNQMIVQWTETYQEIQEINKTLDKKLQDQ